MTGVQTCRSEEHTSELQSHDNLVCRLLLEKKKTSAQSRTLPLRPPRRPPTQARTPPRVATVFERSCSRFSRVRCVAWLWDALFFFNDPGTPEIYTLSLHAALPI